MKTKTKPHRWCSTCFCTARARFGASALLPPPRRLQRRFSLKVKKKSQKSRRPRWRSSRRRRRRGTTGRTRRARGGALFVHREQHESGTESVSSRLHRLVALERSPRTPARASSETRRIRGAAAGAEALVRATRVRARRRRGFGVGRDAPGIDAGCARRVHNAHARTHASSG